MSRVETIVLVHTVLDITTCSSEICCWLCDLLQVETRIKFIQEFNQSFPDIEAAAAAVHTLVLLNAGTQPLSAAISMGP